MDSEVAALMTNNFQRRLPETPLDTDEIRKYAHSHAVLADRGNLPAPGPQTAVKPRAGDLELRKGSGRVPQAKRFCIRIQRQEKLSPALAARLPATDLGPEELKFAILQQAIAQRRQIVAASLRKGSKRLVKRPQFNIVVNLPEPTPKMQPLPLMTSTQMAQLATKTPGSAPSPMEGIPERVSVGRRHQLPSIPGFSPDGFSPMEGLGELRQNFHPMVAKLLGNNNNNHPIGGAGDDNAAAAVVAPRVESPVEGLVHQAAAATNSGPSLAPAPVDGFAFGDVGGTDGDAGAAAVDDYDDDFGGGDDGGWDGGWGGDADDFGGNNDNDAMMMPPPPPVPTNKPKAPRRQVQNPGVNLRKQLPRKSLALNPQVGRQEMIDEKSGAAVRRSMRAPSKPLKYWLNEDKIYTRVDHKTMPTVKCVEKKFAKTPGPWKMVSDPRGYRDDGSKRSTKKGGRGRKRKAAGAGASAGGAVNVDEDDEIVLGNAAGDYSSDEETEIVDRTGGDGGSDEEDDAVGGGGTGGSMRPIDLTFSSPEIGAPSPDDNDVEEVDAAAPMEQDEEEAGAAEGAAADDDDDGWPSSGTSPSSEGDA